MIRVASGDLFGKDLSVDRPDHGIPAGEVAQKAARLLEATANIPMIMQAKNLQVPRSVCWSSYLTG